jgi:hypothetical protein
MLDEKWGAPPPENKGPLYSDVVNLTGMTLSGAEHGQTDPFVLQISYSQDEVDKELVARGMTEDQLVQSGRLLLGYLNASEEWVLARWGNSGMGSAAVEKYLGSWSSFRGVGQPGHGKTLGELLGSWGVDTVNNTAWAVVDHNSQFAVIPEPATLVFVTSGGLTLALGLMLRRRRSARG